MIDPNRSSYYRLQIEIASTPRDPDHLHAIETISRPDSCGTYDALPTSIWIVAPQPVVRLTGNSGLCV